MCQVRKSLIAKISWCGCITSSIGDDPAAASIVKGTYSTWLACWRIFKTSQRTHQVESNCCRNHISCQTILQHRTSFVAKSPTLWIGVQTRLQNDPLQNSSWPYAAECLGRAGGGEATFWQLATIPVPDREMLDMPVHSPRDKGARFDPNLSRSVERSMPSSSLIPRDSPEQTVTGAAWPIESKPKQSPQPPPRMNHHPTTTTNPVKTRPRCLRNEQRILWVEMNLREGRTPKTWLREC